MNLHTTAAFLSLSQCHPLQNGALLVTLALPARFLATKALLIEPPLNFTPADHFKLTAAARISLFAREHTPPPEDDLDWEDTYDRM